MIDPPVLVSSSELADSLGISEGTLARYRRQRKIPGHVRVGQRTRWMPEVVYDWIRSGAPDLSESNKQRAN